MGKLKAQIQEAGGFQHWFVNSFWYHYKWPVLVVIVIVVIVLYITADAISQDNYDGMIVVASKSYMTEDNLEGLTEVLEGAIDDVNGDGKVNVYCQIVYMGDGDLAEDSQERMLLYLSDSDYVLYLMDGSTASTYANEQVGYFNDPLSDYGLESINGNPYLMNLTENALLLSEGLENMYLGIMDYTDTTDDEDVAVNVENALKMIDALLESG